MKNVVKNEIIQGFHKKGIYDDYYILSLIKKYNSQIIEWQLEMQNGGSHRMAINVVNDILMVEKYCYQEKVLQ